MLAKALHQCTIQFRGCSATQYWCEESSICCSKPSTCPNHKMTATTRMRVLDRTVWQETLPVTHSPVGRCITVPNNSAKKGEGIIGTSGQSCSQPPINITWGENYDKMTLFWLAVVVLILLSTLHSHMFKLPNVSLLRAIKDWIHGYWHCVIMQYLNKLTSNEHDGIVHCC